MMAKSKILFAVFTTWLSVCKLSHGQKNNSENVDVASNDVRLFGPFYCQTRCLASCIETNLATTLDECAKYCPPFDEKVCASDDAECWIKCGIDKMPEEKSAPNPVNFVMAEHMVSPDQKYQDPFTIELTWDPVATALLYIVELYPLNRAARPGENNFFRAVTSFPTYTVRKEDECTVYDIRVMPVNAYGIGVPQYTRIDAPRPIMLNGDNFFVRSMKRDALNSEFVSIAIDYLTPLGWPVSDVDFGDLRVLATECKGPLSNRTFVDVDAASSNGEYHPFYNALIGKVPTTAILLGFFEDVIRADCLFKLRISSLVTRCNTTTYFDSNGGANSDSSVGVDFRLNCMTVEGVACDDTVPVQNGTIEPPQPPRFVIEPSVIVPPIDLPSADGGMTDPMSSPDSLPPGVRAPDDENEEVEKKETPPTPPPLPPFINGFVGGTHETGSAPVIPNGQMKIAEMLPPIMPDQNAGPASGMIPNGPMFIPPVCDMQTFDVQASSNTMNMGLFDLTVRWLENVPFVMPAPNYFAVRYGPAARLLVEDGQQPLTIIDGQETFVRTGFVDKTDFARQIQLNSIEKDVLLIFQVCAVYDVNSESLIPWDLVPVHRVDMAAIPASMLLPSDPPPVVDADITSLAPSATDDSPISPSPSSEDSNNGARTGGDVVVVMGSNEDANAGLDSDSGMDTDPSLPLIVHVAVDQKGHSPDTFWLMLLAGVSLAFLTAIMVLIFVLRLCTSRRRHVKKDVEKQHQIAVISAPVIKHAASPAQDVVKVPLP